MNTVDGFLLLIFNFYLFILKNIYLFIMHTISAYMCACRPERAPDLITGCEPPYGCWELNSKPLEEQAMLLTTEPSLQPPSVGILSIKHTDQLSI